MKTPPESTAGDFEPGWYIVLFIPKNNPVLPGKQPRFDVVYLASALVIDCLKEFDKPARFQRRGAGGRRNISNPLLIHFGHMLHHDYPGVYSIGPFATCDTAQETLDQQLVKCLQSLLSSRKRKYDRTFRVMDLTAGIIFNDAYQAAAAVGGDPTAIRLVCRGIRKTHLGHRWAFEDPEAPGEALLTKKQKSE